MLSLFVINGCAQTPWTQAISQADKDTSTLTKAQAVEYLRNVRSYTQTIAFTLIVDENGITSHCVAQEYSWREYDYSQQSVIFSNSAHTITKVPYQIKSVPLSDTSSHVNFCDIYKIQKTHFNDVPTTHGTIPSSYNISVYSKDGKWLWGFNIYDKDDHDGSIVKRFVSCLLVLCPNVK
jgi:hypothetical protein